MSNFKGINLCIINLDGKSFDESPDCPFRKFDEFYKEVKTGKYHNRRFSWRNNIRKAGPLHWYVDGRASAVFGTHTHVQTCDERILHKWHRIYIRHRFDWSHG
jgi:calcineurin-like phosphoesterase